MNKIENPKDWKDAKNVLEKLNEFKNEDYDILWNFDCGFKLDYDGGLVKISSRFYPPHKHDGISWSGDVHIFVLDKSVSNKKFEYKELYELKKNVEQYVDDIKNKILNVFNIQNESTLLNEYKNNIKFLLNKIENNTAIYSDYIKFDEMLKVADLNNDIIYKTLHEYKFNDWKDFLEKREKIENYSSVKIVLGALNGIVDAIKDKLN